MVAALLIEVEIIETKRVTFSTDRARLYKLHGPSVVRVYTVTATANTY
jgi:hypothetical protein